MTVPKSYSQYKKENLNDLGITLKYKQFIEEITPIEPSDYLKIILEINLKQALSTEKAKSEFIIAPILYDVARQHKDKVSFFSGHNLDVEKSLGLKGFCDFIFTKVPESADIQEPIFCVVEAKNDNLDKGVAQCVAEMYASQLFNERKGKPIAVVYGCVTTGHLWQFLKLEGKLAFQDVTIFGLSDLTKILGILHGLVQI